MGIKITKDGIVYECRTVEEAAELGLRLSLVRSRSRRSAVTNGQPANTTGLFNNGGRKFLDALAAADNGLTSVEVAGKLGISMQSLPPLVLGLRRKARLMGMDLDEFVVRERSFDQGKPISRYRLTEEGRKKLAS